MKSLFLLATLLAPVFASAAHLEQSFTPDHLRAPIRRIILENSVTHQEHVLYQCAAASEASCMVELTSDASLQSLFASSAAIAVGTYDQMRVFHCENEGAYHAYITGNVSLGGTTYYTQAGSDPLTTSLAQQGEVQVTYQGCSSRYKLPSALNVTPGSSVEVQLFFMPTYIAWARLGSAVIPSGCKQNAGGTQSVCNAYPEVVPYVSSGATASDPQLELYAISTTNDPDQTGGAVVLVTDKNRSATDASGILAGFTRRIFLENSIPMAGGFDTAMKSISQNGDATIRMENYGSTGDGPAYVRFPHFVRSTHSGDYEMPSTPGNPTQHYYAMKVDGSNSDDGNNLPDCAPDMGFPFSHYPMDMTKLTNIVPLGNVNPGGHTFPTPHTYWGVTHQVGVPGNPLEVTPIYAPGAITFNEIEGAKQLVPDPTTPSGYRVHTDYSLRFGVCKQMSGYFSHINTLEPNFQSAATDAGMPNLDSLPDALNCAYSGSLPAGCKCEVHGGNTYYKCYMNVELPMIAGQPIGTVGNHTFGAGWDFGLRDGRSSSLSFVNPSRHHSNPEGIDDFHVVCPLDYFTPALATDLRSQLKAYGGTPVSASIGCGSTAQDVVGTARGYWYKDDPAELPEDYHVGLAKDNFDDTYQNLSIGNLGGTDPNFKTMNLRFHQQPNASLRVNVSFENVSNSQIYCYDHFQNDPNGVASAILLQVLPAGGGTPSKLRLERKIVANCSALGAPATWSFGANVQEFVR